MQADHRDDGPDAVTRPHRVARTRPLPSDLPDPDPDPGTGLPRAGLPRTRHPRTWRQQGRTWRQQIRTLAGHGRRVATATAAASVGTAHGAVRAGRATAGALRRVTHARGAGESGLARVMELHLVATAADTLILTALASTIFFAVPTQQARGRVATSLLVTMVPFVVLAPLVGPLLDRFRHGRRYALATTMVVRAFLAWVMAGAVGGGGADAGRTAFSLYPAAFGFLVCQKAYIVTRAAALPRVLPHGVGLVAANSRISLAGVAAMAFAAPLGAGINAWLGPSATLRLAFAVFAAGTVLALTLAPRVDSGEGELRARIRRGPEPEPGGRGGPWRARLRGADGRPVRGAEGRPVRGDAVGARVMLGLRANASLRAFTGFLTLFLAFRLRTEPLDGLTDTAAVALVVTLAAVGGGAGTALGGVLRRQRPEVTVAVVVAGVTVAAAWSALAYGLWPVLVIAFLAGFGQSLAKLCLDALIQHDVPEHVRTSAFARSETLLQLAWVAGGGLGLVLPLSGAWGLGIAAAGMLVATVFVVNAVTGAAGAGPGRGRTRTGRRD